MTENTSPTSAPTADIVDGPIAGGMHSHPATVVRRPRVDAVDLLRGLVMVIMLLDHTRDFVHSDVLLFDPTNLERTSPALFFTRWITHFCAPVFVFLAGTGAYLQLSRGKTMESLSGFLWRRGVWLVVLEFVVIRTLVLFDLSFGFLGVAQVIWVIGVSMIVLAGLVRLPFKAVAGLAIAMIVLHNLLDPIQVIPWQGPGSPVPSAAAKLWMILHQQGAFPVAGWPSPVVYILYPLIPWVGVMAAGYTFGRLYEWEPVRRQRTLVRWGLAITVAFVLLRAMNLYGDPSEWSAQRDAVFTVLSFFNTTKYPPSLLFLMMTLGPAFVALAWFERTRRTWIGNALVTFGRVPLFFYVLQWAYAHTAGIVAHLVAGKPIDHLVGASFGPPPPNVGFDLPVVYLVWALGVLLLYPLCRWFARLKQRRSDWWLSYI